MIKILLADDVQILRAGLKAVIAGDSELTVVGEASNGKEALEMATRLRPDVVLMDMRMPDFDGSYGTRQIKASFPEIKVLVLTTFDDQETVDRAVAAGADGYILKDVVFVALQLFSALLGLAAAPADQAAVKTGITDQHRLFADVGDFLRIVRAKIERNDLFPDLLSDRMINTEEFTGNIMVELGEAAAGIGLFVMQMTV